MCAEKSNFNPSNSNFGIGVIYDGIICSKAPLRVWNPLTKRGCPEKSGNVMQQTMHSYVCGINLRLESSLVLSDLHFA